MASIVERNHKFKVVYYYKNDAGKRIQKWETYDTKAEARKRKKEIDISRSWELLWPLNVLICLNFLMNM